MRYVILVMRLIKVGRIIGLVTVAIVWTALMVMYPMLMMLVTFSIFAAMAMLRQLNFYKIMMMLKRYARKIERLRFEIRAIMHTGFRDYNATLDEQNSSRSRITGCV